MVNGSEIADGSVTDFNELGVKALDDKTVEITLEGPTPFFLQALTHYTAYPVPKHLIDKVGDQWTNVDNIVSNGPYTITEWVPGSYIKSVKSETYWDAANVQIDEVNYFVQDDLSAALSRYRAGEYDILTDIPSDQAEWIKTNLPGQDYFAPFLGIYYYVINQEKPPFDNPDVRKALSMAINRDVIGPDVLGTGELPMYGWVPEGTANYEGVAVYQPEWIGLSYEERVAEAKTIMEGLGYTASTPLQVQLKYNTNDNHQRIAVAISSMWEQIGVKTELFNSETAVHYDALRVGDFQIGRAGWLLDYSDPSNTLDLLRTGIAQGGETNWGNNYGRYSNPEFDSLMEQATKEQDLAARAALLGQAEKLAMDEYAAIPIYNYIAQNVVAPSVTGFVNNAADIHRTRWLTKTD
ncbi:MAG: peptide ABC transporter substrate-binding protein [Proteobacteria bacterium]|nr:MAG: peptide ABC transporter substrate-binding protein [Pseudomonadota bacterium]